MLSLLTSGTALLGILIAIPLILMWRTRPPNLWLGLFLLSMSLIAMGESLNDATLFGVFHWPIAALGPLYFTYVLSVVGRRLRLAHAWHAVPVAAYCGVLIVIRLDMAGVVKIGPATMVPIFEASYRIAQVLCCGYLMAVFHLLHQHRRHVRDYFSSTASRDLTWLTWLSVVLSAVFVIWIVATRVDERANILLTVARVAILYFVAWFGSRQVAVFQVDHPADAAVASGLPPQPAPAAPDPAPTRGKYARSGMTDAARDLIGRRLQRRMHEQHDYLDSDLTLDMLAEHIGTLPHLVSQYLNDMLETSFFDYVNGHRVAAVERKMVDPATRDMTLLDMALASGFNSKSTFNAAFKRVHGMSPSAWRRAQPASATSANS